MGQKIFTIGGVISVIFGFISFMAFLTASIDSWSTVVNTSRGMTFLVLAITVFLGTILLGLPRLIKER